MTNAKFAEGPWECVGAEFGEGELKGLMGYWVRMPEPSLSKADADLITAAPDLYEALKVAQENIQFMPMDGVEEQIAAALAKAEGKVSA